MAIQSTRRNPSLPRRTPAKTKVIAQPEVPERGHPPQDFVMGSADKDPSMYYKGVYTPPPAGGWPGGTPPWLMPSSGSPASTLTPPSFGTTAFRSGGGVPSGGGSTAPGMIAALSTPGALSPTVIPPGVAGVKTSTMRLPSSRTYVPSPLGTSVYPGGYPGGIPSM